MTSLQPDLWIAEFVTFPAATVFLILRLSSRRITGLRLWWDDCFAILCYATAVAWAVMLPIWIQHGFGLHSEDVQGMTVEEANYTTKKYLFIIEHLYAFTLFFAKISILSFYWRMFRVANIQFAISILLTCSILWVIVRIFLTTFHCYPVKAFWDPSIKDFVCPIKSADFFFGTVLAHVVIDVGILILPIIQIQKLQLPVLQKIAIIFLFLFGTLVCVAGIVIVRVSAHFDNKSDDMTFQLAPIIIWASVEVNLVTISTCLPIIRPACLFMMTCTNPTSKVDSGSSEYRRNYPRTQTKHSIHLTGLPKAGSSSTHVLTALAPSAVGSTASVVDSDNCGGHRRADSETLGSHSIHPSDGSVSITMVKYKTGLHKSNVRPCP
ncbi:l-fucose permease [Fusarium longipes]|uniref:L-fucose permease n=1 Tax=Fusarium longipes TaxID=694270 RepID=A0A395SXR0_9HYPO|nr:l-fucose permease [Fusarium longipes]